MTIQLNLDPLDFDLAVILGRAIAAGEDPKVTIRRLLSDTGWVLSRPGEDAHSGLYMRGKTDDMYESWSHRHRMWIAMPYVGNEKTFLPLLATEQFEKFLLQQQLDGARKELEALTSLQVSVQDLRQEVAQNHVAINKQAEQAAALLNGIDL